MALRLCLPLARRAVALAPCRATSTSAAAASVATSPVWLGPRQYDQVLPMRDCNALLHNRDALLEQFDHDGYLLIRGLHNREHVLEARRLVLFHLAQEGGVLDPKRPVEEGRLAERVTNVPFMEGCNKITHSDLLLRVLESPRLFEFFETLFGEPAISFQYKWLRAVPNDVYTGAHVDNVYMQRGTSELVTCWTPFGDVDTTHGTLAVLEGSHRRPEFDYLQTTYGNLDVEKVNLKGTGWFTTDPEELRTIAPNAVWRTTNFEAGDVLLFKMRTMHMSTTNRSGFARISCDTRWQPASHKADPRYVENALGHQTKRFGTHADAIVNKDEVTIEELKKEWGFPLTDENGQEWLK